MEGRDRRITQFTAQLSWSIEEWGRNKRPSSTSWKERTDGQKLIYTHSMMYECTYTVAYECVHTHKLKITFKNDSKISAFKVSLHFRVVLHSILSHIHLQTTSQPCTYSPDVFLQLKKGFSSQSISCKCTKCTDKYEPDLSVLFLKEK